MAKLLVVGWGRSGSIAAKYSDEDDEGINSFGYARTVREKAKN